MFEGLETCVSLIARHTRRREGHLSKLIVTGVPLLASLQTPQPAPSSRPTPKS